jgi:hypothetical protein
MSTKKARNGAGTVERRGALWWVRVSFPLPPGVKLARGKRPPSKRVPIADSEKMPEPQAKRAGAKVAADVRAGRIVFKEKPRKGSPLRRPRSRPCASLARNGRAGSSLRSTAPSTDSA